MLCCLIWKTCFIFIIKVKTSFSLPPSETVADCNKKEKNKRYLSFMICIINLWVSRIVWRVIILLTVDNARGWKPKDTSCYLLTDISSSSWKSPRPLNHCPGTWFHKYLLHNVNFNILFQWIKSISQYIGENRYLSSDPQRHQMKTWLWYMEIRGMKLKFQIFRQSKDWKLPLLMTCREPKGCKNGSSKFRLR